MAQKRKSVSKQANKPKKATRSAQELEAQVSGAIMGKEAIADEAATGTSGAFPAVEPVSTADFPEQPEFLEGLREAAVAGGSTGARAGGQQPGGSLGNGSSDLHAAGWTPSGSDNQGGGYQGVSGTPGPGDQTEEAQSATPRIKRGARKKKRGFGFWLRIALAVILVCLIGTCAVIGWDRWMRYDDAADFQGKWMDAKTGLPITIDGEEISISGEVAYPYELDTWAKSVSYSFSNLEGGGMYLFSDDRQTLYLVEGEQRDLVADVLRMVDLAELPDYSANEKATVLVKGTAAANAMAQIEATQQNEPDAAALAALAGSTDG